MDVTKPVHNVYKAHIEHGATDPDAMDLALQVVNRWGRAEATLAHAIAEALRACYEAGVRQEPFPYERPAPPTVVRRSRPAPEPTPAATTSTVLRRRSK